MEILNNNLEERRKLIICPNNGCLNIPKINYISDLFYLLIECDNKNCNLRKVLDINNYINKHSNQLKCKNCFKNISYYDTFNYCLHCKDIYDPECILKNPYHKEIHSIFKFNNKSYYNYCLEHIKKFIYFCVNCDSSLCQICLENNYHSDHKIMNLDVISPDMNALEQIKKNIEEQEILLEKVKKIIGECITKFENDIKLKKLIYKNFLSHKRNYNSIYNIINLSLKINETYKAKIENIYANDYNYNNNINKNNENDDENKYQKTSNYTRKMLSILYYYIMYQDKEKENKILSIINKEFNLKNKNNLDNNNYISYNNKNYEEDNKGINSRIKSSKLKLKHSSSKSKTIKNIVEEKIITSIAKLKSGNLIIGFRNGLIKIYDSKKLCYLINGNEEILLIDRFKYRKISYIYELNDNTLLCSTYSKIYIIRLKNNDTQYEYISKIKLTNSESAKQIIQLGEVIICLNERNRKEDKKTLIECFLRIFKINSGLEEEEELGFLSDFDNEKNAYNTGQCFASDISSISDYDNLQSFDSGGIIDDKIILYKKNIKNNSKYICSIFPTKINNDRKNGVNDEYFYEFIATSTEDIENSNGENKIYFYGINKNSEGNHRLNFNKIGEIDQISCSSMVGSICKINKSLIGIAIQKYREEHCGYCLIDINKREVIKIFGSYPFNLINISESKNFILSLCINKEEFKNQNVIQYIQIDHIKKQTNKILRLNNSKTLITCKSNFSHLIEIQSGVSQNQSYSFYSLFANKTIFIIKLDFK